MTRHWCVLVAVMASGLSAGRVESQLIRFERGRAEIGGGYEGRWREAATGATFQSTFYREWVGLPFTGVLLDPRLFHYTLRLKPIFSQQAATGYDDQFTTRQLSLSFAGTLFQASRMPITLSAARDAGRWRGGAGVDRDFAQNTARASLWFDNRWLPAEVAVSQRSSEYTWLYGPDESIRQAESVRGFLATANNSKLTLHFEHRSFEDRVFQQNYAIQTRSATHRLRWGKNSRLNSSLASFTRTGFAPYSRFDWTETLHIQHTGNMATGLAYSARSYEVGSSKTSERSLNANSAVDFRWLRFSASGNSSSTQFDGGHRTNRAFVPTVGIQLNLPLRGQFAVSGFSGVERLDVQADADGGIDVVDERHEVSELRSFFLDSRFIDLATVVVRSEDQTTTYIVDRDYRLIGAGSLLRLVVPVGSRIQIDDVLLVSYRYRLVDEGRQDTRARGYSVLLRLAGFTARRDERTRNVVFDGRQDTTDAFDSYDAVTAFSFDQNTPVGHFLFEASRTKRRSTTYADVSDEFRGNHSLGIGRAFRTDVTVSASRTRSDGGEITAFFGGAGLGMGFASNLGVTARANAWRFHRDDALVQKSLVGTVSMDWQFASVDTEWTFEHIRNENGTRVNENRFTFRVVRRF